MEYAHKKEIELYSFDIFDTVITRKTATPKGIFAIMQQRLKNNPNYSENFIDNFYDIRVKSENAARKTAYKKSGCYEIIFNDIYQCIKQEYFLSDDLTENLKKMEIECEAANIVGINKNIEYIKDLINKNKKVILISDMYHSAETLHKLLLNIDSVFDNIKIYVSSEYCASKSDGTLYKLVQKEEGVSFKNWMHIGDNEHSDIKKAKKLGINAKLYSYPELLPYEKDLIEAYPSTANIQALIGISKLTRLNLQLQNQNKYDFGASFGGPIFYNYVMDVIQTSLAKGYKTLYFIARDGYIPKLTADIIIQGKGLPLKTKYIYGSRLAWRIPDENNYEYYINILFDEYQYKISPEFLAYRLGVSVDLLLDYLPGLPKCKVLNQKVLESVKNIFLTNVSLKEFILESYKERRELLLDYLKQEIDFSEEKVAFVEVNGSGRTQLFLTNYINRIKPCEVSTFYITVSPDNIKDVINQHVYSTRPKLYNTALELLCRTTYGQTVGYKKEEKGLVVPILDEFNLVSLKNWGYDEYLQGLIDFTKNMLNYSENVFNKEQFYEYFDYLNERCDKDTAAILGDVPFALIGTENKIKKAAPELSICDLLICEFRKNYILKLSQYPSLSYARGNQFINNLRKISKKIKNSSDLFTELKLFVLLMKLRNKKVAFWGASIFLEKFIKRWNIKSDNILVIIDKDKDRHNQKYGQYMIQPPQELANLRPDYVIMTIKNNNKKIYKIISESIEKEYNFTKLIPNIF